MSELTTSTHLGDFRADENSEAQPGDAGFPATADVYPAEISVYGSPARLIGLTDHTPVYVIPHCSHNGLPPIRDVTPMNANPALEVYKLPRDAFEPSEDSEISEKVFHLESHDTFPDAQCEWDDLVGWTPNSRRECIDALKELTWTDTTSTFRVLVNPSLDVFPEHFKKHGLSHHLAGLTETGLAYYDTQDEPCFTICTMVDREVTRWNGKSSFISVDGISTNHLPYAQYLARVELEGDGWTELSSLGRSYLRDYIESVDSLSSLV